MRVIVDMGLPDRKATLWCGRCGRSIRSLPIVIASGQGDRELRQLFKDMALVTFVSKPITLRRAEERRPRDRHPLLEAHRAPWQGGRVSVRYRTLEQLDEVVRRLVRN